MLRAPALATAMAVLMIGSLVLPVAAAPERDVSQGEDIGWENRYAILEVKYSLTRPDNSDPLSYLKLLNPDWIDGTVKFELYEFRAPKTTANFIQLAESGFYDGTIFHRIIDDFVCQGGDPDANDPLIDGSGETVDFEPHPELTHVDGAVGMARGVDKDSAESQFYICDGPQHQLDHAERQNRTPPEDGYVVFGVVVEGLNHIREMAQVWTDTDANNTAPFPVSLRGTHDRPVYDVTLKSVTITEKVSKDDGGSDDAVASMVENNSGLFLLLLIAVPAGLFAAHRKGWIRMTPRSGD